MSIEPTCEAIAALATETANDPRLLPTFSRIIRLAPVTIENLQAGRLHGMRLRGLDMLQ